MMTSTQPNIITPEELIETLPDDMPADSYVVALEINFRRLVAQIYRHENNRLRFIKSHHIHDWHLKYDRHTRGIQDPLMNRVLIELGVFWTPLLEIQLESLLDLQQQTINEILRDLSSQYIIGHLILVGEMFGIERVRNHVANYLRTPSMILDESYSYSQLAEEEHAIEISESVQVIELTDYYDLLILEIRDGQLWWSREPLFAPDKVFEYHNKEFPVAPDTDRCYFLVGKFTNPDSHQVIALDKIMPEDIAFATTVTKINKRQRVKYDIQMQTNKDIIVQFSGCDHIPILPANLPHYLNEIRQIRLQNIPMQTVFIVDDSLSRGQYTRVQSLIETVTTAQSADHYWLMFIHGETKLYFAMGERFLQTPDFKQALDQYAYQKGNTASTEKQMGRIFEYLAENVAWDGDSANYYVFITKCVPSDALGTRIEALNANQIKGLVIFVGDREVVQPMYLEKFLAVGQLDKQILVNDLQPEQIPQTSEQVRRFLEPTERKQRQLVNLPAPYRSSTQGWL